jgi:hypothetical protein
MKLAILLYLLIFSFQTDPGLNNLTFNQLGLLNKIPNGPIDSDNMERALINLDNQENGKTEPTAIIQIPDSMKAKKLGKTRIFSNNLNLIFPDDKEYNNYIQDVNPIQIQRNAIKENIISESELNNTNPFPKIIKAEKGFANENYTKHLLELAVEREQEIYNKSVNNEIGEVNEKRFNKGLLNPLMRFNRG